MVIPIPSSISYRPDPPMYAKRSGNQSPNINPAMHRPRFHRLHGIHRAQRGEPQIPSLAPRLCRALHHQHQGRRESSSARMDRSEQGAIAPVSAKSVRPSKQNTANEIFKGADFDESTTNTADGAHPFGTPPASLHDDSIRRDSDQPWNGARSITSEGTSALTGSNTQTPRIHAGEAFEPAGLQQSCKLNPTTLSRHLPTFKVTIQPFRDEINHIIISTSIVCELNLPAMSASSSSKPSNPPTPQRPPLHPRNHRVRPPPPTPPQLRPLGHLHRQPRPRRLRPCPRHPRLHSPCPRPQSVRALVYCSCGGRTAAACFAPLCVCWRQLVRWHVCSDSTACTFLFVGYLSDARKSRGKCTPR